MYLWEEIQYWEMTQNKPYIKLEERSLLKPLLRARFENLFSGSEKRKKRKPIITNTRLIAILPVHSALWSRRAGGYPVKGKGLIFNIPLYIHEWGEVSPVFMSSAAQPAVWLEMDLLFVGSFQKVIPESWFDEKGRMSESFDEPFSTSVKIPLLRWKPLHFCQKERGRERSLTRQPEDFFPSWRTSFIMNTNGLDSLTVELFFPT